jgi:lipoprotein-anchoring transpeptidase ErfK/SrfK
VRYKAQDFERARMLLNADGSVLLDNIGAMTPGIAETSTEREANTLKASVYSRKTVPRKVDVNLTTQTADFIEGDFQVRRSLITSGEWKYETPIGTFAIFSRVPNERMKNGKPGDPDYYDLSNVLYTQYFTPKGHALHYAWWRTTFGYRDSHGCINEDINTSRFAWDFLTIGDKVVIHY